MSDFLHFTAFMLQVALSYQPIYEDEIIDGAVPIANVIQSNVSLCWCVCACLRYNDGLTIT